MQLVLSREQNTPAEDPLLEALLLLKELHSCRVTPTEARGRLSVLQESAPELDIELVWERAGPQGDYHYDLLLSNAEGTVSLGFAPPDAQPWPLRGAQRWSDRHLLRVDNEHLDVGDALGMFDFLWSDSRLLRRLVDDCIVRAEVRRRGLRLSQAELQERMDAFRVKRGLAQAEAANKWMAERGLTLEKLEAHVEAEGAQAKLMELVADGQERRYFESKKADFEAVTALVVSASTQAAAEAALERMRADGPQLLALSELLDAAASQLDQVSIRTVTRAELEGSARQRAVFDPAPGLGDLGPRVPWRFGSRWECWWILSRRSPAFDERTQELCRKQLFERWLVSAREKAKVEWFWGPPSVDAGQA